MACRQPYSPLATHHSPIIGLAAGITAALEITGKVIMAKDATRVRRRERKKTSPRHAHVNSSFNNTITSPTRRARHCLVVGGTMGFKGSRKSTPMPRRSP